MKTTDLSRTLPRHPSGKKYRTRRLSQINKIVVHCTDCDWSIQKLAKYDITPFYVINGKKIYNHIDPTGLSAITYHDIIMKDGRPCHTLSYNEVSAHAGGWNTGSIAVALMYRVSDEKGNDVYAPTKKALKTLQCHLGKLCLRFGLTPDRVFGHRELKGTGWFLSKNGSKRLRKTCPGLQVDLDQLRRNVAIYMQLILKIKKYYTATIDGIFGKKSRAALAAYLKD